jgi:hypothetical protein
MVMIKPSRSNCHSERSEESFDSGIGGYGLGENGRSPTV